MAYMYDLVMKGGSDSYYSRILRLGAEFKPKIKACVQQAVKRRTLLRKAQVFDVDSEASHLVGVRSMSALHHPEHVGVYRAMAKDCLALEQPLFIGFHLQALLDGVKQGGGTMFDPSEPRHQRRAGFLYVPTPGGPIRAYLWTEDVLPPDNVVSIESADPLVAVIGGAGDPRFDYTKTSRVYAPFGLTTPEPELEPLFGLEANTAEYAATVLLKRRYGNKNDAEILDDRTGVVRRALYLLHAVMVPQETVCLDPVAQRGSNVRQGRSWRYQSRQVTLRLEDPVTRSDGPHAPSGVKMPEHPVRGHWRTYRACQCAAPDWQDVAPRRQVCSNCKARRTFIREHTRGDPEVGVVDRAEFVVTA